MRRINFFDGAESETTPVIGNLVASNLVQYDSDASYEATEQGAPTTGNIYYNTTLNLIRYYNGAEWISLVDESSTQTVTGKLLDADNNTITNIENDNIKAGAAIDATKLADGSVSNTEFQYINTLTSNAQDQLDAKQDISEKGQPNGYASLDGSGKIPSAQIPPVAITDVSVVADNAARDALIVEEGDIAYTTDSGKWWLYDGLTWLELTTPATVNSVNGQTGTVVLDTDDISEGATNKYANGSIDTHSDVDVTTTPPNDGDVLTYNNGTSQWEPLAPGSGTAGRLLSKQVFTSSGTWNKPVGVNTIVVEVIGAGGGGGSGDDTAAGQMSCASGGGAGGYARKLIDVSAISSETITIGAGGSGAAQAAGTAGGTSSFGSHCSATGGTGGVGSTSSTGGRIAVGVSGGTGISGDINATGGGSDSATSDGTTATATAGGNSNFGGGGSGRAAVIGSGSITGINGGNYGAGGSGTCNGQNTSSTAGGNGSAGIIIVWEYS